MGHSCTHRVDNHRLYVVRRVRLLCLRASRDSPSPQEPHIRGEQGLLKTFGRVMPVLMTLCVILSVSYAISLSPVEGAARIVCWASAASFIAALISTIIFNVPINLATRRWNANDPPEKCKETRNHWEFFQGLRSWLLLIGFVLLCLAATLYS